MQTTESWRTYLRVEGLEDRAVPPTFTVTTAAESSLLSASASAKLQASLATRQADLDATARLVLDLELEGDDPLG